MNSSDVYTTSGTKHSRDDVARRLFYSTQPKNRVTEHQCRLSSEVRFYKPRSRVVRLQQLPQRPGRVTADQEEFYILRFVWTAHVHLGLTNSLFSLPTATSLQLQICRITCFQQGEEEERQKCHWNLKEWETTKKKGWNLLMCMSRNSSHPFSHTLHKHAGLQVRLRAVSWIQMWACVQ